jgi:hypothetical protein
MGIQGREIAHTNRRRPLFEFAEDLTSRQGLVFVMGDSDGKIAKGQNPKSRAQTNAK